MSSVRQYYLLHLLRGQLIELTSTRPHNKSGTIWKKNTFFILMFLPCLLLTNIYGAASISKVPVEELKRCLGHYYCTASLQSVNIYEITASLFSLMILCEDFSSPGFKLVGYPQRLLFSLIIFTMFNGLWGY